MSFCLLLQATHDLLHFGREFEHQADAFGGWVLLAFAKGAGLVEDFGPLGCVPAQKLGRQKFAALLVGERIAKSEIHCCNAGLHQVRRFCSFLIRSTKKDVRPHELALACYCAGLAGLVWLALDPVMEKEDLAVAAAASAPGAILRNGVDGRCLRGAGLGSHFA